MEPQDHLEEVNLSEYVRIIRQRRWYVVVPMVAALVGAVLFTLFSTPLYQAQALLRVNAAVIRPQDMDPFSGLFLSRSAVPTFIQLAKSPLIRARVASTLRLSSENGGLGEIRISTIEETEFFSVSVKHPNPDMARDIANELALALKNQSEAEWAQRVETVERSQRERLDVLSQEIQQTRQALAAAPNEGETVLLQIRLREHEGQYAILLRSLQDAQMVKGRTKDVLIIQTPATAPTSPVSSRPLLNIAMGLVLGAILGVGAAFAREYLDNRVKSPEQVRRLLGVPVIGALPRFAEMEDAGSETPLPVSDIVPIQESYHMLRTNLEFSWHDSLSRTVLVTSAGVGEGKSTVLANLGVSIAGTGKRVILVDADLQRPRLHEMFGVSRNPGLADLLATRDDDPSPYLNATSYGELRVLSAGSHAANPAVLMTPEALRLLLEKLRGLADVVLLDSPPLLFSSHALVLAAEADHVLLVMGSGMLHKDAIHRARRALDVARAKRVDLLLNKVSRDMDPYAYYSYYYYYSYQSSLEEAD